MALGQSGTRWPFPAFIRSPGTVQILFFKSISDQRAPITSPVRAAVRIRNSNARALIPSLFAKGGHEARKLGIRHRRVVLNAPGFALCRKQMIEMAFQRAGFSPSR